MSRDGLMPIRQPQQPGSMISRGLVLEGTPTPASKDRGRNGPRIIVGSSPSMHNRLICASQRAENSRPPAAPILRSVVTNTHGNCSELTLRDVGTADRY